MTTHQFTAAEGAGGHCEGFGQDRLDQTVYGWLSQVLRGGRPLTAGTAAPAAATA